MPIYSLAELRATAPEHLKDVSDEQLIVEYSASVNMDPFETADFFGVKTGRDANALFSGISSGVDTVQSLGYSTLAAGSRALGLDDTSEEFMRSAEDEQSQGYLAGRPEYERVEDLDGIGDYLGYGVYQIGKQLPIMGGIAAAGLATGGVGAVAGSAAGAAAGVGLRAGISAGTALASYGTGVGSLYQSAYDAEQQGQEMDLAKVFGYAVPYAAAERLVPTVGAKLLTGQAGRATTALTTGSRTGRTVAAGLGAAATESATELVQTELEISMNPFLSEEEKYSQRLNAAVAGGVSGGALGAAGGLIAGKNKRKAGTEEIDMAKTAEQEAPVVTEPTVQADVSSPVEPTTRQTQRQEEREVSKVNASVSGLDVTDPDEQIMSDLMARANIADSFSNRDITLLQQEKAKTRQLLDEVEVFPVPSKGKPARAAKEEAKIEADAKKKEYEAAINRIDTQLNDINKAKEAQTTLKNIERARRKIAIGRLPNKVELEAMRNTGMIPEAIAEPEVVKEAVEKSDKKPQVAMQDIEATQALDMEEVNAEDTALVEALNKLDARYSSEQGKASGKLTLDKGVIKGVVRMLRDEKAQPKGRVTVEGSNKTDVEKTAQHSEHMADIYDSAMAVITATKDMYDAEQNAVRTVNPLKKKSEVNLKAARRGAELRSVVKQRMEDFIKMAGSEKDAEAIIEALKTRNEKADTRSKKVQPELFAEMAGALNRASIDSRVELGRTIDTLLSVPFADYKNGQLDSSDVVSGRNVRYNKKYETNPSIVKKLQDYIENGYQTKIRGRKVSGFLGVLESITDVGGTDTAYEKALAGGIKQALIAMQQAGIEDVQVKFLEDTTDEFPSYNPVTNTITISKTASKEEILHEGLHAVTQWFVDSNPESEQVTNLNAALDELIEAADDGIIDGMDLPTWQKQEALEVVNLLRDLRTQGKDNAAVLELVSYGATMHSLKRVLKGINAVNSKPDTSRMYAALTDIWKRLIKVIAAAIGAPDSTAQSILDNTFWILDSVIADPDQEQFAETRSGQKLNYGYNPKSDANHTTPSGNQHGDMQLSNYSRLNRNKVLSFQAFFDFIHWDKLTKFSGKKLNSVAQKIRDEYPGAQRLISYFNAEFNSDDNATKHIRTLKKNVQIPQQAANYIAERLKFEPSKNVMAILSYLDGDTKAIEGLKDYARLEDTARQLREKINLFASILPKEEREFFTNGKFSEALLFVSSNKDIAKQGFTPNISSLIGRQFESVESADVDTNPEFYRMVNGKPDMSGEFYKVTVYPGMYEPYSVFVDSEIYDAKKGDLGITGARAKADEDTIYTLAGRSDKKYSFKAKRNYKQAMDKSKAENYAYAIENTIHALATNYASRNFTKAMAEKGNGIYVLDDQNAFDLWKMNTNIEREQDGKPAIDYILLEGDAIKAAESGVTAKYRARNYWVVVPNGYGELSGKIMHGPVWAHINDATDRSVPFESIAEITRIYKKTKTVYNPGTQITNVASNVSLMMLHDISFRTLTDSVELMWNYQKHPERLGKLQREMISKFESTGAIVGNFSAQEVTNAMHISMQESITSDSDKSVYNQMVSLVKQQFAFGTKLGKLREFAEKTDKYAVDMYSAGDNMFRLALYMKTVAELTEMQGLTDPTQQIYEEAADVSKKGFMDYDIDEKAVRYLRASALPFVSWFFRATQVVGKLAVTKPWKLAKLLTVWAMLDALMAGMAGDDEERREAGDPKLSDRLFGIGPNIHMRIPFLGDTEEDAVYYRIGDYFPLATSFNGLPNGFAGIDWWPSAINPSGPIISGITALVAGVDPYTGEKLSGPTDTSGQAFVERMKALYDMMGVPALRSSNLETMYDMAFKGGKKDFMGRELSWTYLALAKVGGLKLVEHSDTKEAVLRGFREREVYRDFSSAVKKAQRDALKNGAVDFESLDEQILELYQRQQDEINEIYKIEDE